MKLFELQDLVWSYFGIFKIWTILLLLLHPHTLYIALFWFLLSSILLKCIIYMFFFYIFWDIALIAERTCPSHFSSCSFTYDKYHFQFNTLIVLIDLVPKLYTYWFFFLFLNIKWYSGLYRVQSQYLVGTYNPTEGSTQHSQSSPVQSRELYLSTRVRDSQTALQDGYYYHHGRWTKAAGKASTTVNTDRTAATRSRALDGSVRRPSQGCLRWRKEMAGGQMPAGWLNRRVKAVCH